ncbi:hypothetical protein GCM10023187_05490 [Nibrella viscosa]|uniref:Uncharacterized protein n=1 Tax=Nibrella viscosa TaxID=1084524 RepID=A0ABP8JWL8_9BACT
MTTPATYEQNVFINCPFDEKYKPLFQAIVFTVQVCRFIPRCALETMDASHIRLEKIMAIIEECKYGIHDISVKAARHNMPLELGIFVGCRQYGKAHHRLKQYMVLEGKKHSSKVYLSDLSGQDYMAYNNKVPEVIGCVRNWLADKVSETVFIPHAPFLCTEYEAFRRDLPGLCAIRKWSAESLSFKELLSLSTPWINARTELSRIDPSQD